ncbi:MAG TPA: hypothetical protein VFL55_03090 [Acetobacteraceae bacterium]|jgi:hypothetical protein|nr:hypothetical protein [Acetobacteraceae bacterium]
MRSLRQTSPALAWPSLHDTRGRLLGLPFVLTAFAPGVLVGWQSCVLALVIATLASFLVYVPLTVLALNHGDALSEQAPVPALTARAYAALLTLWTGTAWLAAVFAPAVT